MQKILRLIASICLLVLVSFSLAAQNDVIRGSVVSASGEPVVGAGIVVKGSPTRGVVSDASGLFSIPASKGETLVISCLGFVTEEVVIGNSNRLSIVLDEDTSMIDETIVVGYAPMRKSDFTGSVASVKASELQPSTPTLGQALVGRVAGVEIRQSEGAPGSGVNIRVRGVNSLTASTAPLYVVDGYPVADDDLINPNDIESIEILKDAASAAIYGSRGASGVVLITTKRGVSERATVTYDYSHGIQSLGHKIDLLNAREFAELYVDARNNSYWAYCQAGGVEYNPKDDNATRIAKLAAAGINQTTTISLSPFFWDFAKNDYASTAFMYDTDWQDEYFGTAGSTRHNVSVKGGNKNIRYMASLGYLDQDGIIAPSNHKQINARLNLDAQVSKTLSLSVSYAMTDAKTREVKTYGRSNGGGENGEGYDGATQACLVAIPNFPAYNTVTPDLSWASANNSGVYKAEQWASYNTPGTLARSWMNFFAINWDLNSSESPLVVANDLNINRTRVRSNLTMAATYEPVKDLKFKLQVGRMWNNETYSKFRPNSIGAGKVYAYASALETSQHYAMSSSAKDEDSLGEFTVNYKKGFGSNHRIDALAGVTIQDHTFNRIGIRATQFSSNRIQDVSATINTKAVEEYDVTRYEYSLLSYLARLNYSYADRYTVTGSFRADGSSRFGKSSKWGYFPSISAGWTITNEPFLKDAVDGIMTARLRASWGMSGNNNIGNYASIATIDTGTTAMGNSIVATSYESSFVDEGLSWETTKQTNIGLDLGFLNGRVNLIANFYNSISTDVLYSLGIPSISGSTSTTTNLGDSKIRNRGFDIQLDARILQGPVTWTVGTNFSLNRNKVLFLSEGVDEILSSTMRSSQTHITRVGYPIGSFFGYRVNGIMSTADYQNVLLDRQVYLDNGNKFPENYTLKGPAVPDYGLEYLSPGNVIYNDTDGNKLITDSDREILGSPYPDFTGGFNTTLAFKGFDLSLGFTYSMGAKVVNFNDYYAYNMEGSGNQYGIVRERWVSEDRPGNGFVPRAFRHGNKNTGLKVAQRYFDDADYFRLSTASIGYNFPKTFCEKIKSQGLRIYVSGDNLFTLTNYRGFNPEVDQYGTQRTRTNSERKANGNMMPGFDWGSYPVARVITCGFKLTF